MTALSDDSTLRIVHVYPTVLGLYGDRGNALVLAARAGLRGIQAEIISIEPGESVPAEGDIYLLGGGEDLAQTTAAELLRADDTMRRVIEADRAVLAVCAGMQILGHEFNAANGLVPGLGLLDVTTRAGDTRAVGELLVTPHDAALALPTLTGYENHRGRTTVGPEARPLGRVDHGIGNGDGTEGVVQRRVIGTYLHGPALARNPALADLLLGWATGETPAALADRTATALRDERIAAVLARPGASSPSGPGRAASVANTLRRLRTRVMSR